MRDPRELCNPVHPRKMKAGRKMVFLQAGEQDCGEACLGLGYWMKRVVVVLEDMVLVSVIETVQGADEQMTGYEE